MIKSDNCILSRRHDGRSFYINKGFTLISRKQKRNNLYINKGFTLIEFIIVMAIIGILVLMAAPKFMDYVREAKLTQIKNDERVVESILKAEMANNIANDLDIELYDEFGIINNHVMENVNTKLDKKLFRYDEEKDIVQYLSTQLESNK